MCEVVCKLFRPIVVGGLCKKAYETRGSGDAGTRPVSVYSIPCQRPLFHENRIETPKSIKIQMPPAAVGLFDRRQKSGVPASQHSPSLLRTPHDGTERTDSGTNPEE